MAYIDKDKLSEDIRLRYCKDCNNHNEVKCRACWIDDMLGEIEDAPTADVAEVKHGYWIKKGNEKKCSVCKFIYYSNNDEWNGCPNCLAKMDGKDNNVPTNERSDSDAKV